MSLHCARCGHTRFEVHLTASSIDRDVDVAGQPVLYVNHEILEEPDTIDVEAVCLQCRHVRYVDIDKWEWV